MPERAVRAGLELVAAVSDLKTHAPLQTRVGIATGLVVVGDLIGSGASQEQAIVGETPNLAARLQGVAEPNSVVIAESTRKLVGNLFELDELGPQDLKGVSGSVRAWAAMRTSSAEGRFEAFHSTGLTELVGREEELDLLLRRWSKAKAGQGQVVLLTGEPGIGKSRLTAALLELLAAEPHTRLRYFCSPQHSDSALYPIISQMERAARFAHDDTPQAKLDKLDTVLAQSFTPSQDAALLAEMLSLPNDGRYPILELAPQQRRQKTMEALTAQLEVLSRSNPVLMTFEDAHWLDPTSLEVLGRSVDRLRTLGVLLIVTYRPEFEPPWIGRPHVTALTLNRLEEREVDAMIDRVTGNKAMSANIRQDIIERTDGIPLFVEEMTKAVLEAEGQGDAQQTVAAIPPSALAVPASLHASLMARLDRLGSAKEVAQIGAAIGREFSHPLLAAVVAEPEAKLQSALDRLINAGLLFQQGAPPQATYLFKHALVQDAAYGTLLRDARRALHARIAGTLESQFAEIAENQPELLARHCTEAGLTEKAASFWGKAGQRSLARSALIEAVEQLTRALDQIGALPSTPALRWEQIKFQVALITPLMHVKGYGAPETRAAAERADTLIQQAQGVAGPPDDPLLLFSVLYGVWATNLVAFNGDILRQLSTQFLSLAEKQETTAPRSMAQRMMGTSLLFSGEFAPSRAHLEQALMLYDPPQHRSLATPFGLDIRVTSLFYLSYVRWFLGYPDAALADADYALKDAREIGHAATLMVAMGVTSLTRVLCGDYVGAIELLDQLATLADEKGSAQWKAFGTLIDGCVSALTGGELNAVKTINSALLAWRATGSTLYGPVWSLHSAIAHAKLCEFDDARCRLGEAITTVRTTKEKWWEAEINRTAGEIALMSSEPDVVRAQSCFDQALTVARQQQAKSWELRAAMSLARLWRDQGKPQQARELLAPVYGWFTEGFDTLDLKEAKALLEELAA